MSAAPADLTEVLRGARNHPPQDFEGHRIETTWAPEDGAALGEGLAAISGAGLAAIVRGAGLHSQLGGVPTRADLLLSTEKLCGVEVLEPAEGVCRARAGTRLAGLRAELQGSGWELPLDAPDAATLGGVLGAAVDGPRCHGYGPVRDAVLGLDVVLSGGERTRCGGRVVKNVTGYDLAKLYVGSLGSLGVIEAAWLRLRPCPERVRTVQWQASDPETAAARALAIGRHVAVRACGWSWARGGPGIGIAELASDAISVDAALSELELDAAAAGDLSRLRPDPPPGGLTTVPFISMLLWLTS